MTGAWRAGALYFFIVFVFAFACGIARTLVIAPIVGDIAATAIELPLVLGVAWLVSRRLARNIAGDEQSRLIMGGVAFTLLMLAEFAMAVLVFGRSSAAYGAAMISAAGLIGLAGQVGFALIPVIQRRFTGAEHL